VAEAGDLDVAGYMAVEIQPELLDFDLVVVPMEILQLQNHRGLEKLVDSGVLGLH
jgi:hypothetical protein